MKFCVVVDVPARMQLCLGGAPDEFIDKVMTILRSDCCRILLQFSHSVHSDVECRFFLGIPVLRPFRSPFERCIRLWFLVTVIHRDTLDGRSTMV